MNEIKTESIDQLLISHRCSCRKTDRTLHIHNNAYEIMLFKSGNVDYFINNVAYHLKPGDLTFICPNDIHGYFTKDDSPYERMPIHMEETFASSLSTDSTDLMACFQSATKSHICHLDKKQIDEFEAYTDMMIKSLTEKEFGYDIRVKACLTLLLLLANTALHSDKDSMSDITPEIIQETITYINDNLTNDLSIQTIAGHLNMSRSRLSHVFKDFTGTSVWNYIVARRIQYAGALLGQGVSITTACYECGFRDYAHFIKVFSKINGISPGRYAKNMQTYLTDVGASELHFQ